MGRFKQLMSVVKDLRTNKKGFQSTSEMITLVLLVVFALALTPTIATSTNAAAGNLTGAASTIVSLIPLVYVFVVIGGVVAYIKVKK